MAEPKVRFKRDDGSSYPSLASAIFGNTVIIERGGSPRPIENYLTDGEGYNWIKIGDAPQNGNYITQTVQKIIPEGLKKTRKVLVGDLILSNSMSFGRPYIMGIEGCIHDGWLLIRNNQNIYDLTYLCYLLSSDYMFRQYKSLAAGSAVNNLNKDLVAGTRVFIPCLEEQQKIADFLSSVDEVITASEQEVANLETQKKAVMKKLFSQEVRFKRADGREFSEWEDIHISDMLTICHGRDYKHLKEGSIPVMGTGGVISYVDEALCDWECVCIGRKGTIDRPYYMNEPFWSVDTLFYTKPKDGFLPKYQFYVFQNIDWKFYNEATGVPSLSASTIEKISVSVASLEEQRLIVDFLSDFDEAIASAKKELELWKELKKGLLQQMFV